MKKWIIIFVSVIILLTLFLCRFKYFTSADGHSLVRINRFTGQAKLFECPYGSQRFVHYKREEDKNLWKDEKIDFSNFELKTNRLQRKDK